MNVVIFFAKSILTRKFFSIADAMAHRGDMISCTVMFEMEQNGKVPIVFTLNGRQITHEKIHYDNFHRDIPLYPYIGMGTKGIRVLARVSEFF